MNLPVNFLKTFLPELIEKNVKIETIGFYEGLPQSTIDAIDFAKAKTQHNTGLTLVFAINYGGRAEIIQSMKAIYNELQLNGQGSEVIDEALIKRHLMTHSYPDPDLLIRTSGEQRISNFLIWQASYSEFIFNEKLWPDFDEKELRECLKIYQSRQRRFGGLSEVKMKVRTLTAIIALLIFLPILLKGGLILMLFAFLLALIALKELLNMNMIKFLSIPGLISALALIIIMLPQDAGEWVQVIQLKGLIAMSFIVLSYTVLSKTDLVLWMLHFV